MPQPTPEEVNAMAEERELSPGKWRFLALFLAMLLGVAGYITYFLASTASSETDIISLRMVLTLVVGVIFKMSIFILTAMFARKRRWSDLFVGTPPGSPR